MKRYKFTARFQNGLPPKEIVEFPDDYFDGMSDKEKLEALDKEHVEWVLDNLDAHWEEVDDDEEDNPDA